MIKSRVFILTFNSDARISQVENARVSLFMFCQSILSPFCLVLGIISRLMIVIFTIECVISKTANAVQ